jgi:hypothetical protein
VTEVTPEWRNAELVIVTTESGRAIVVRALQDSKRHSGIVVICDGDSKLTDESSVHDEKTEFPRVDTEGGTLKDFRRMQPANAHDSILWTLEGSSKRAAFK